MGRVRHDATWRQVGCVDDYITKHKQAEALLSESEERYRTLFERSADATLVIKGDRFVDCNQATVDMLGCRDKDEILNLKPIDLSPEFQPDGLPSAEKALDMIETYLHHKNQGNVFQDMRF